MQSIAPTETKCNETDTKNTDTATKRRSETEKILLIHPSIHRITVHKNHTISI